MTETPMRRPGPTSAPRNAPPPRPPRPVRDEAPRQAARRAPAPRRPAPNAPPAPMFFRKAGPVNGGFVATLLVLVVFGLLMLFSASTASAFYKFGDSFYYIRSQALYAALGLGVMWAVSRVDYHWLRQFTWPLYGVVLILLVVVIATCDPINGCRRWLYWEGVRLPTVQVSEIAKFSMILCTAHLFEKYKNRVKGFQYGVLAPAVLLVPVLVLLVFEPHYSAMVLMCCITAAMMFCGGTGLGWFGAGLAAAGGGGAWFLMTRMDYVQERLAGWLDPFSDVLDSTHQTAQSLYTIGSGGLFGVGLGNSVQKHLWLPEAQNDFIFSVLCEELGFVGALLCILLFALLLVQGIVIAVRSPDRFGSLLVVGVMAQVGFQFMFNVAVVTNTVPNTGISLPFFSSGGTSLLLLLGEMGVVLSVCRAGNKKRAEQRAAEAEERARQAGRAPQEKTVFHAGR